MRIAILANGTRGDIQPILAIGDELRARGHSVVLTVNANMVEWARRSGLEIVELGVDWAAMLKSERGQRLQAKGNVLDLSREVAEFESRHSQAVAAGLTAACDGADLIASTILTGYDGLHLAEKHRVPTGMLVTMPFWPTAQYCHPMFPLRRLPLAAMNRGSARFLFWLRWRDTLTATQALRDQLGLHPMRRRPRFEEHAAAAILCSEHLVPRPPDWPERVVLTGFPSLSAPFRQRLGEATPPDGLTAWLDGGDPPVYFGFGSLPILDPAATLDMVAELTMKCGVRGLIGAGWTDYGSNDRALPPHLFIAPTFDHDAVLPRCLAAVHHGGAGTTAAALRAGLPSVVASAISDQAFWGWLVQEAGSGVTVPFRRLSRERLERSLRAVLRPAVRVRAQELGARLRSEDGTRRAADEVERWANLPPVPLA